jgi:hypothetical protein
MEINQLLNSVAPNTVSLQIHNYRSLSYQLTFTPNLIRTSNKLKTKINSSERKQKQSLMIGLSYTIHFHFYIQLQTLQFIYTRHYTYYIGIFRSGYIYLCIELIPIYITSYYHYRSLLYIRHLAFKIIVYTKSYPNIKQT